MLKSLSKSPLPGLRSVTLRGQLQACLVLNVKVEEHVQASKASQFSLGIFKRASMLKKTIQSSFRRPSATNLRNETYEAVTTSQVDNSEVVSDRDSGFLSINSSMNSPGRVERNGSPPIVQEEPHLAASIGSPSSHSIAPPRNYMNKLSSDSCHSICRRSPLNILQEESAKAEVMMSSQHRKAKSLSMTDEMLPKDFDNLRPKPVVPPKRYQSFRDKPLYEARSRDFTPSHTNMSRMPFSNQKPPSSFFYSVSNPVNDTLYKVIEESSIVEDSETEFTPPAFDYSSLKRVNRSFPKLSNSFISNTSSLNRSFIKQRSSATSK